MNIIKILIGKLLSFYRYRNGNDAFKIFNKMKVNEKINTKKNKGNILFLPISINPTSNLFEGLLSYTFGVRGYQSHCLLEFGELDFFEGINVRRNKWVYSCLAMYEQFRFHKIFNSEAHFFSCNINKEHLNKLVDSMDSLSFEELLDYSYNGINNGKHAKYGLMRYLMVETIKSEHHKLLKSFLVTSLKTQLALESVIKKTKPKLAVLSHGCYSTWGTALDVLKKEGVESSVWGRGYMGQGNMLITHNDTYLYEWIHEPIELWINNTLSTVQIETISNYYEQKTKINNQVDGLKYYKYEAESELDDLKEKCASYELNIGVYPNIPWDGTMCSSTDNFPNIRSFVRLVKKYAIDNPMEHIIIRAHPAESFRKKNITIETFYDIFIEEFEIIPSNVTYLEPSNAITSYQVSDIVDANLMYGSTLSLEFAVRKKLVIQVGRTNTTNKGIIFEAKDYNYFMLLMEKLKRNELLISDEMNERSIKYAYHWIMRKHLPETLIDLDALNFKGYLFDSKDALFPGENKVLDFICEKLINREPVILDRESL
ncbi:hypothetical protein [Aliivibrio wodanis]|uniref:hypothetical protein n=1 Tax=Aliivibrio wodanis TaxID=80852 RepID=UPI00406CC086